jgi:anti-sigma factor RsiW
MNDCIETEVRDALPDLIHGRLSDLDTATLTAHVESCADCRAEMELLRQLRASAPLAPRIDVARIVSSLPLPLPTAADLVASESVRVRPAPRRSFIWKTAMAASLLVVGSLTFANSRRVPLPVPVVPSGVSANVTVPPAASAQQAASVPAKGVAVAETTARSAATVRAASNTGLSLTGVQDLTDDQLQALVNGLDNVKGLPSEEPEAISIGVDDNEGMQ